MKIKTLLITATLSATMAVVFSACGGSSGGATPPPVEDWYKPLKTTTWQWQLQPGSSGELNLDYDVDLYDIDLFDTPQESIDKLHREGKKVICYFSAGTYEDWRDDADEFPKEALGDPLDHYPSERWLDIRHDGIKPIMLARLDKAKEKKCDGVEPDNIDGYTNDSGFKLTYNDQIAYNTFLAQSAHEKGLSIGLKNDLDQIKDLVSSFDFIVNESCHKYDECDMLKPFISDNKPVFNAEYDDKYHDDEERSKLCQDAKEREFQTLFLPKALDDSFRYDCN
jgi:hypothetical protein